MADTVNLNVDADKTPHMTTLKKALTQLKLSRKAFQSNIGWKRLAWFDMFRGGKSSLVVPQSESLGGEIYLGGLLSEKSLLKVMGEKPIVFSLTTRKESEATVINHLLHPDKHSNELSQVFCPVEDHGFQDPSTGLIISLKKLSGRLDEFQNLRIQDPKRPALIHCWGGAGRSAATFIMWMTQYLGILPDDASMLIKQKRKKANLLAKQPGSKRMNPQGRGMVGYFYYQVLARDLTDKNVSLNNLMGLLKTNKEEVRDRIIQLNLGLIFEGDFSNLEEEDQKSVVENFAHVRQHILQHPPAIDILDILWKKIEQGKNLISLVNFSIITRQLGEENRSTESMKAALAQLLNVKEKKEAEIKGYLTHELILDMLLPQINQYIEEISALIPLIKNPMSLIKVYKASVSLKKPGSQKSLQSEALKRLIKLTSNTSEFTPERFVHFSIQAQKNYREIWSVLNGSSHQLLENYLQKISSNPIQQLRIRACIEKGTEMGPYSQTNSIQGSLSSPIQPSAEMFSSAFLKLKKKTHLAPKKNPFASSFSMKENANPIPRTEDLKRAVGEILQLKKEENKLFTSCIYEEGIQTVYIRPNSNIEVNKYYQFETNQLPSMERKNKGKELEIQYRQRNNEFIISSSKPVTQSDIRKFALAFLVMSKNLGWKEPILDISSVPPKLKENVRNCLLEAGIQPMDTANTPASRRSAGA